MNLFNEYENKNISFLIGYINQVNTGNIDPLSEGEFSSLLSGEGKKLTSPEIVDSVLNKIDIITDSKNFASVKDANLFLLFEDESELIQPLMDCEISLPYFVSFTEKCWLKSVLNNSRADLFISPFLKRKYINLLKDVESPLQLGYVIEKNRIDNSAKYTDTFKSLFSDTLFLLKNHFFCKIYLGDGSEFTLLPCKMIYNHSLDRFSLLGYQVDKDVFLIIDMFTISLIRKDEDGIFSPETFNVSDFSQYYEEKLETHKAKVPVRLEIIKNRFSEEKSTYLRSNADERFAFLFSGYDTITFEKENGNLISDIYYYDFQYEDVFRRILSLGKYAVVLGPDDVRQEVKDVLLRKSCLYS